MNYSQTISIGIRGALCA